MLNDRPMSHRYAYLHGFASGPRSRKGVALARVLGARGITLERPDLNRPSFARLSHDAMLAELDAIDEEAKREGVTWRFVGSSLGGWLAARWAELHPDRVDRLVLLCPGFDLSARWPKLFGADAMAEWAREGEMIVRDGAGDPVALWYGFYQESLRQPAWPVVPCPTVIVHGTRDVTVPVESSRRYASEHANVRLVEVDDDHEMTGSIEVIAEVVVGQFEL